MRAGLVIIDKHMQSGLVSIDRSISSRRVGLSFGFILLGMRFPEKRCSFTLTVARRRPLPVLLASSKRLLLMLQT